ncbi:hypothetical protein B0H13DRAFT_1921865 [Mycena leptocephala]|nr:hypothetical protein B0H13DRAFT_1921865 [Mycena leptocephala]
MADPVGALWFALLQLLILSLSQEICPLRGLSTQSTSSSLKLATTSPPAFFYARHKSWDWYWPCQNRCPLLHHGPFGFNPDPILLALPPLQFYSTFIIASSFLACLHLLFQSHGRWTIVWLASAPKAASSSRLHMCPCQLRIVVIPLAHASASAPPRRAYNHPPPLRGPRGGYPGELHADTYATHAHIYHLARWFRHYVWCIAATLGENWKINGQ